MTGFSDRFLGTRRQAGSRSSSRPLALVMIAVMSVLFQVYAPRFLTYISFLELPLLVTTYLSLLWRKPVNGLLVGCAIGLAQDAFSHQPIGIFGIVKTLVGYFAASLSLRVDVENLFIRFLIGLLFYCFHQLTYWVLVGTLLAQVLPFGIAEVLLFSVLNGLVAVPLFGLLDRL
jgi:rod shape-determining protein MreD